MTIFFKIVWYYFINKISNRGKFNDIGGKFI